jgi:hypothetical protein
MKSLARLLPLILVTATLLHAADPVLDWKRATELYQREQKGETLNEEEKAYLYEARRQRTPAAQRPPFKGLLPAPGAPAVATLASAAKPGAGFDWPTFRGATRDDVSKETGLLKNWPAGGPKKLWSYDKAGMGYSGFAIAGGQLYTLGSRDDKETLICLDANTGKELWVQSFGPDNKSQYNVGWGEGPRSSPTADGDRVYALGATGEIVCFAAKDGKKIWSRNMADFGGKPFGWGYSESPLVDGDKLVCTPGGSQGAIVALNKMTGATLWQTKDLTGTAQYSSLVPANIHGKPQYVQLLMESIAGVSAQDGKLLWRTEWPGKTAVIPTPIVRGNQVFATSGYGVGCKAITVSAEGKTDEVFRTTISPTITAVWCSWGTTSTGTAIAVAGPAWIGRPGMLSGRNHGRSAKAAFTRRMACSICSMKRAATAFWSSPRRRALARRAASSSSRKVRIAIPRAAYGRTRWWLMAGFICATRSSFTAMQ